MNVRDVIRQIQEQRFQHSALNLTLAAPQGNFVVTELRQEQGQCLHICQPQGAGTAGMRLRDIYTRLNQFGGGDRVVMQLPDGARHELTALRDARERGTSMEVTVAFGQREEQVAVARAAVAAQEGVGAAQAGFTAQKIAELAESLGLDGGTGGITVRHQGQDYGASGIIIGAGGQWTIECGQNVNRTFAFDKLSQLVTDADQDITLLALLPNGQTTPITGVFVGAEDTEGLHLTA